MTILIKDTAKSILKDFALALPDLEIKFKIILHPYPTNVCRIMHICPMEEEIRLREGFYRGVCYDLDI